MHSLSSFPRWLPKKITLFSFHKSLFKNALLSHFWASKGGTPEGFHICDLFQGFPNDQHFWKTLKVSTAPNIDPQNKGHVSLQPNQSRKPWWTNNRMTSDGSPRPWWLGGGVSLAKFWKQRANILHKSPQQIIFMFDEGGPPWFT